MKQFDITIKISTISTIRSSALLGLLSGILLLLALPPYNVTLLVWVFPIPLFWVIERRTGIDALIAAYVCGMLAMNQATYGLAGYSISIWLLIFFIAPVWAILPVSVYLLINFFYKHKIPTILLPAIWVSSQFLIVEYGSLPLDIGVIFIDQPYILQLASVFGSPILTFLVILFGALSAKILIRLKENSSKKTLGLLLLCMSIPTASTLLGGLLLENQDKSCSAMVSIAQPSIPAHISRDSAINPAYRRIIRNRFNKRLDTFVKSNADIFVWPEGSGAFINMKQSEVHKRLSDLSSTNNKIMFITALGFTRPDSQTNSVYIFTPSANMSKYDKHKPIPFAEDHILPGSDTPIVTIGNDKVGTFVCFDVCFSRLVKSASKSDVAFFVVSTNDIVFGISSLPELHLRTTMLRAVENRKSIVHASNGGPSAIIDSYGTASVLSSLHEDTNLTGCITKDTGISIYTSYGYIFVYLLMGYVFIFLVVTIRSIKMHGVRLVRGNVIRSVMVAAIFAVFITLASIVANAYFFGIQSNRETDIQSILNSFKFREINGQGVSRFSSGTAGLEHIYNYFAFSEAPTALVMRIEAKKKSSTLADLQLQAIGDGFEATINTVSAKDLINENFPVLLKMSGNRYAVLHDVGQGIATIYEASFGYGYLKFDELQHHYQGVLLQILPGKEKQ